jgi:hypothetical protein
MSAPELIALASTVSLLAGWRLYLVTFAVGLAMKFGWIALPDQLQALDVLTNDWIIGIAGLGAIAEFFADKIAWVDSAWDAIHGFVRPIGGALLAMAIIGWCYNRGFRPADRGPILSWQLLLPAYGLILLLRHVQGGLWPSIIIACGLVIAGLLGRGTWPRGLWVRVILFAGLLGLGLNLSAIILAVTMALVLLVSGKNR